MTREATSTSDPPRSTPTTITVIGLLAGAAGIVIQFLALPADFPTIPPGPIIVTAAAAAVAFGSRLRWSPLIGVAVALMIIIGGVLNGGLMDNLTNFPAPSIGVAVMLIGLTSAIIAGVVATVSNRRPGRLHGPR